MPDTPAVPSTPGQTASEKPAPYLNAVRITRDEFETIVKHATVGMRHKLTLRRDREVLKLVGKTSEIAAVFDWCVDGIDCPARQAGIPREEAEAFTQHYDFAVSDLLRETYGLTAKDSQIPRVIVIDG